MNENPFELNQLLAQYRADPRTKGIIEELQAWPGPQLSSHKSANQFFHKLVFLADIGIKSSDEGIPPIIKKILLNVDESGIPCLPMAISEAHGGNGQSKLAWALCDAPSILYALVKMEYSAPTIDSAISALTGLIGANAYPCAVSPALGNWRGPGKKSDPCPYASLIMLKLLLLYGNRFDSEIRNCSTSLLYLWETSRTHHPYIFYMGTDFRKLKLPFIWYDILHVVDVLSQVEGCKHDPRLREMFAIIQSKETNGGYIPESVYQVWKDWDFGQKKQISAWLTGCIRRIEQRLQ